MRPAGDGQKAVDELPPLHRITTLAALRAVSDDQRHRMLTLLIARPLTARTLATHLRMSRTKLYYHLDLLERQGLIRVAGQRVSGRQLERVYRAVARSFRVDTALLGGKTARGAASARAQIFRNAARDFQEALVAPSSRPEATLVSRALLRLKPAQFAKLRERLQTLISELDTTQEEGEAAELLIALFPTDL
jgi:DNA-binding transcriptional ArsR family regulator